MRSRHADPDTTLDIRRVPLTDLTPDPDNARVHNTRNLDAIEASLREFGQRKPLVVTADLTVVAGNGTLAVMDRLGWEQVWVAVFDATPDELRAYSVADNRTGELAEWDIDRLLANLDGMDDRLLAAVGFTGDERDALTERFDTAPDLDALAERHGAPLERTLWPTFRLVMPAPLLSRYHKLTAAAEDEAAQFVMLVELAERATAP